MSTAAYDVVVVGAGAIGLSVAYHLALEGCRVAVVERDRPGSGASSAAAGMLAAQQESDREDPLFRLCVASRDLYPAFAERLREDSGVDIELERSGILALALDEAEAAALQERARWQERAGQPCQWWDGERVREEIPGIAQGIGGLYFPRDGHISSPRLVTALAGACRQRGVTLLGGIGVTGLCLEGTRVRGIETSGGTILAGETVLAAGAHTGELCRQWQLPVPVFPVRGQVVVVEPEGMQGPWLRRPLPVFAPGVYLVPKRDGSLIIGATVEPEAGFDRRVTLGGTQRLGAAALAILPSLAPAGVRTYWSGLRPGTPDHRPILGRVPGHQGLWVASGHYRNGVLLTPITGRVMADLLLGRSPAVDVAAFDPGRFASPR